MTPMLYRRPILFFDDECALCWSFIKLIHHSKQHSKIDYAALSGETAKAIIPKGFLEAPKKKQSLVFMNSNHLSYGPEGIIELLRVLGGEFRFFCWIAWLPRLIVWRLYRLVAKYRYRLFGKQETSQIAFRKKNNFLP